MTARKRDYTMSEPTEQQEGGRHIATVREARTILVAGPSGSGKTTLATQLGLLLDIPHTEIDSLFHGPNWEPRPSFEQDVDAFMATGSWVTEWQYHQVRDRLLHAADVLLWLDYPRRIVMYRVIKRSVARRITRRKLWNGNIEPPLYTIFSDKEHIIRWAWSAIDKYWQKLDDLRQHDPEKTVIVFKRPSELKAFIRRLEAQIHASTNVP